MAVGHEKSPVASSRRGFLLSNEVGRYSVMTYAATASISSAEAAMDSIGSENATMAIDSIFSIVLVMVLYLRRVAESGAMIAQAHAPAQLSQFTDSS